MVDMAHFAGLVAGGVHPNPLEWADVVTTTTHKTLRGPRGGMILTNNEDLAKKFNSAIFPGSQGGPLEHVIAAKAVCFKEDLTPEFKQYAAQILKNAKVLGETLKKRGLDLVSGGTDTHLLLVDLRPKGVTGDVIATALDKARITCNKNAIPFDPMPPKVTSGIRIGTPAMLMRLLPKQLKKLWLCVSVFRFISTYWQRILNAKNQFAKIGGNCRSNFSDISNRDRKCGDRQQNCPKR